MAPAAILRRHAAWLAVPLGALHSLAFAPTACWPLGLLCLAALFAAWDGAPPKRAAAIGFGFGALFAYFALYGVTAGVVLGAVVGIIIDRVSSRRAKTVSVEVTTVEASE